MISLLLALWFPPSDYHTRVSVEAALAATTYKPGDVDSVCCGLCTGGKVIHGDGHVTECPCPSTCKCRVHAAVLHPPIILKDNRKCSVVK